MWLIYESSNFTIILCLCHCKYQKNNAGDSEQAIYLICFLFSMMHRYRYIGDFNILYNYFYILHKYFYTLITYFINIYAYIIWLNDRLLTNKINKSITINMMIQIVIILNVINIINAKRNKTYKNFNWMFTSSWPQLSNESVYLVLGPSNFPFSRST